MSTNNNDKDCCALQGQKCICMAYNDPLVITSIVLSAIAFLISWVWWLTWLISLAGLIMFQILWCCRQPSGCMYVYIIIAGLCAVCSIGSGIWVATKWRDDYICVPFYFWSSFDGEEDDIFNINFDDDIWDDDFSTQVATTLDDVDLCFNQFYAGLAITCGVLWAIVTICITIFVTSGRHARFEEKFNNPTAAAVELPSRAAPPPAAATPAEATPVEATPVETMAKTY